MSEQVTAIALDYAVPIGEIVHAPHVCMITREITRGEFLRCLAEEPSRKFGRFTTATREYEPLEVLPEAMEYFYLAERVE